jgi:hypothetical protein
VPTISTGTLISTEDVIKYDIQNYMNEGKEEIIGGHNLTVDQNIEKVGK